MPNFKVGDRVERVGPLVPEYARSGVVTRVIPNTEGMDWLTEYEVDFGTRLVTRLALTLYETQLRPVKAAQNSG